MSEKSFHQTIRRVYLTSRAAKWALLLGALVTVTCGDQLLAQNAVTGRVTSESTDFELSDSMPMMDGEFIVPSDQHDFWEPAMGPDCGFGCPPTWRARGEVLYLNREGDVGFTHSTAFRLADFDYEEGYRITIGRKFDCTVGWEVNYMGPFEWVESGTAVGAGTLNSNFIASGVNISAFDGANVHEQTYRSELQSAEAMQKWWGWDVITTSAGVRYINVREDYVFRSVDANGDIGLLEMETNNQLIGPQLGIELLYPVGDWSLDSSLKGALYANFGDGLNRLTNAGIVQFDHAPEDLEFAASVESGTYVRRAITPRVTARVGYEFLWIYGLGTIPRQVDNPITPTTGGSFDGQGDTFYHGGSAGIEIIW